VVHLLDDAYQAALPANHPLTAQRVIDLADLAGEPWVGSEPPGPCLEPIIDACAAAGFSPNFVAQSEDYATGQGFVAAGLGVSLIPGSGWARAIPASPSARSAARSRSGRSTPRFGRSHLTPDDLWSFCLTS
jgi:DNA-binding transcriptional LysR family regulator